MRIYSFTKELVFTYLQDFYFFFINKGLGFTDLISLPVYIMDTEKVLHPRSGCAALFAS